MKKVISVLLIIILSVSLFFGCNQKKTYVNVYFKDKMSNNLSAEKRLLKKDSNSPSDVAKFALSELIAGPQNEASEALLPKEAKLLKFSLNDGVATVNMSSHFAQKEGTQALLLRLSFVNTLCEIKGIDGIVIQVEGKPIISETTGKEIGVLSLENIALNTVDTNVMEKKTLKLYFPDKEGGKLRIEKRSVEIQNALSLEKTVVSELIKGPSKDNLSASIPAGTKLLGIETKDNVCFVNFSSEFVSKTNSGSLATTMTLYSVVNSLCALDGVSSVQVLINGENGVEMGNFVLDIPYEKNENIVG
ncbi:MAG: GerMN domain-containing protein [Clostridia bacterium]|nr:GerMN domain-containing protein [Clostridia bacterium]